MHVSCISRALKKDGRNYMILDTCIHDTYPMKKKTQRIILAIVAFFVIVSMVGFTFSFGF